MSAIWGCNQQQSSPVAMAVCTDLPPFSYEIFTMQDLGHLFGHALDTYVTTWDYGLLVYVDDL